MKLLQYITLLVVIFFTSCAPHKSSARMTLYLDDNFNKEAQTCYVYGVKSWISGNEFAIFDSVKIKQGQKKVRFKVECPMEMAYRFCFTKRGPICERIAIQPQSKAKLYLKSSINNLDGYLAASGKGTEPTCAERLFMTTVMDSLQHKIESTEDADLRSFYKQQMTDSLVNQIRITPYPIVAFRYYIMLRTGFSHNLKDNELNSTEQFLQEKFDHPSIQNLSKHSKPTSSKGKHDMNLIGQIKEARSAALKQNTTLGAPISLILPNKDSRMVSLQEINTEYILVDFWASWCKPCQKEMPYLKEALDTYRDKLSIYAVSIDRYYDSWMKGITRDGSESFVHVIGSDKQGLPNAAVQGLGIKSIPSNFLLDKNKCIIAKDLRGDELIHTLDGLMNK